MRKADARSSQIPWENFKFSNHNPFEWQNYWKLKNWEGKSYYFEREKLAKLVEEEIMWKPFTLHLHPDIENHSLKS